MSVWMNPAQFSPAPNKGMGNFLNNNRYTIGGLISGLGSQFTGDSSAPYEQGMNSGNQYYQEGIDTQKPFYNAGIGAIPQYQDYLSQMRNPSSFINNLMGQYSESPWAKIQQKKAIEANNNMASAAGLVGSTPWQQSGEQYARDISAADQNQWLQNVLGVNTQYGGGLNNIMNYGFNAGNIMSQLFGKQADMNANMAYNREAAGQNDNSNLWGNIGSIASLFL